MTVTRRIITEMTPALAGFVVFAGVLALVQNFLNTNPHSALPILLEAGQAWALTFFMLAALGAAIPTLLIVRWAMRRANGPAPSQA
ncbi:hypothetical protein [Oerskovia merdavium]|uniref:DUF1049 domain-containing protein n=1 Tax=Oerskovia merdavium TaxID=2762227 RepID=A0ABR8U3Y2_9CELL|nr:hypothetical protein [Oerskovia merdavium]MBD7982743.1 hypothetical protein [Oerskovia merdavium]